MLIEEGILSGVGETIDDVINSLTMVRTLDFDQVREFTLHPAARHRLRILPRRTLSRSL